MEFKTIQLEMSHYAGKSRDDEIEADIDGGEGLAYDAIGKIQVKKALRLLTPVPTHWNSMYYLIKRALAMKDLLIYFTMHMQLM